MRVALATNWKEHCGVSEYAVNLISHLSQKVEYSLVSKPLTFEHIMAASKDVDVIHFNYCSYTFRDVKLNEWGLFKNSGKKIIITFHDSTPEMTEKVAQSGCFDLVVTHEPGKYSPNVRYIPQGLNIARVTIPHRKRLIGTIGVPFPWKGFHLAAQMADKLEMGFMAFLSSTDSDSERLDIEGIKKHFEQVCSQSYIMTGWHPYSVITKELSSCTMLVFPYDDKKELYGISSAVRCGLATRRPVIVSRCSQFKDLFDYEDEVYFMDEGLESTIVQVLADIQASKVRIPNRVIADMNWERCAGLYMDAYKELYDSKQNDEGVGLSGTGSGGTDAPLRVVRDRHVVAGTGAQ